MQDKNKKALLHNALQQRLFIFKSF